MVYTDGFTTRSVFLFSGDEISPFFDHEIGKRIGIFWVFSSVNSTFVFNRQIFDIKQMGKKNTQFC
jgi:hypothetical protein